MLAVIVLFSWISLSLCQGTPGRCYSSRNCVGEVLDGYDDEGICCSPGKGLSYLKGGTCQECFSMEEFTSEGSSYNLGLYGNFKPPPFFSIGLLRLAMLSVTSSPTSGSVTDSSGTTPFTANPHAETSMSILNNVVSTYAMRDKGILVNSSTPFSLVAYDEEFTSADAYKALPCVRLPVKQHYEYYAMSVPRARIPVEEDEDPDYEVDDSFEPILGNSVFMIVTCEEGTDLNITLTQDVQVDTQEDAETLSTILRRGSPFPMRLANAGSTLLFSSENDLSGSRIISSRPVTLLSGHECGSVPSDKIYCDHMAEQFPPTVTWGTQFLTAPIRGRTGGDIFKVIAAQDNTQVEFFCNKAGESRRESLTLSKGGFANVSVDSSLYCFVSSNGPILLVQFALGSAVDNARSGDPFMVIVPPIEQYKSSYSLWMFKHTNNFPEQYYVNILVPEGTDASNILMNGEKLDSNIQFTSISGNQRRGQAAQLEVSNGFLNLTHSNSSSFNVIAYWGSFRSGSGYFGGMNQVPIILPSLSFASSTFSVFENETTVNIRCTIEGDSVVASTVRVSAMQYSATSPALNMDDFVALDEEFTIPPGATELIIPVSIVDDVFPEMSEQFEVLLHTSPGVFINSPSRATVTIINDDPDLPIMNVSISSTLQTTREGEGIVMIDLVKTPGALGPVSVQIETTDGTAVDGEDYIMINEVITFEVEELSKTVLIFILDNNEVEEQEEFQVTITALPGVFPVAVQDNVAVISIADNDIAIIGFEQQQFTVAEGDQSRVSLQFSVLFGVLSKEVEVLFSVVNGTASEGEDYLVPAQPSYLFNSSMTRHTAVVNINNDNVVEPSETFTCNIRLSGIDNNVMIFQNSADVVIEDADTAVIVITSSGIPMESGQNARLEFSGVQPDQLDDSVSIHLQTANIDAEAGKDYMSRNITVPLRDLLATEFIVVIINDNNYEGDTDERFLVMASVVNGGQNGRILIQPPSIEISISDDDPKPSVLIGFTSSSYTVPENGGQVTLVVSSDGVNQESVTVSYMFSSGTAQDGLDASLQFNTTVLAPGATTGVVTVNIIDDSISETRETFVVQLLPASGIRLTQDRTEIIIIDNDAVQVTFQASSYTTLEGGESVIPIQKRGLVDVPVSVSFSARSGTALAMMDFTPTMRTVTFSPSEETQQVMVDIMSDDISEGTGEFFLVELLPGMNNSVQVSVDQGLATVTIMETAVLLSAPPLVCNAVDSTSINCTWTKPERETVVSYLLTWDYIGPCDPDTQSFLLRGSDRGLLLTDLEEGGNYEVSLIAVNSQEQGPAATVSITTQSASPVGSPQVLRTTAVTSNSITLEWDEIVCLDQNGPISEYIVSYGVDGSPTSSIVSVNRAITLTGLTSDEAYSIQVAGINILGTGPFSQSLVVFIPIAEVNECTAGTHNCDVNADCIDTRATFVCRCRLGFVGNGTSCTEIQGCAQSSCDANALCTNEPGGMFSCSCQMGYSGDGFMCTDINECSTISPCASTGSTCVNTDGSFSCSCNRGFAGDGFTCTDIDECVSGTHNCHAFAVCDNTVGGFNCQCMPGFAGDGTSNCTNINECAEGRDNCHSSARCVDRVGSFDCQCFSGFAGNGTNCEDIDECVSGTHNCHVFAVCENTVGGFNCQCMPGFVADRSNCTNIDECAGGRDNCHSSATCVDTVGSFECLCNSGFSGNGTNCEDINECAENRDNCDGSATCINTVGSFECRCNSGFAGNGAICEDIDECAQSLDNCHAFATCTNTIGSFSCACQSGYSGDGVTCADVDECAQSLDNCHTSATCTNTIGSFSCACQSGYSGDGVTCADINECERNTSNCHPSASCTNTDGGFTCACRTGFIGNGTFCEVPVPTVKMGFEAKTFTLAENQTSQICVTGEEVTGNFVISVQSADGTAVASLDYRPVSQTLMFNSETLRQCVEVFGIPDMVTENDEYFTLWLSSEDSVQLDPQIVNITIRNMNFDFIVGFVQPEYIASAGQRINAMVSIRGSFNGAVFSFLQTVDGNATAGVDYLMDTQDAFFFPFIVEQVTFSVDTLRNVARTQNVTFCMAIASTIAQNNEMFGVDQDKAIGVIVPNAMADV